MRVMVAAGGSGGHVYPALAVMDALRRRGELTQVAWVGNPSGIEAEILEDCPWVTFLPLRSQGLPRGRPWRWPKALVTALYAVLKAMKLIRAFRPHVVLGMGGYPAFAPVIAASLLRVPVVVHEQNARLGLVNRLLARIADAALVSFPETGATCGVRTQCTGNPVRGEIAAVAGAAEAIGQELLVFGGSQGSAALVDATLRAAPTLALLGDLRLRVVVGQAADPEEVRSKLAEAGLRAADVVSYERDIGKALSAARLVVARAGATTVAELAAAGRPAILVPWSGAADGHQTFNARALARRRAGLVLTDDELPETDLGQLVTALWNDPQRLKEMGEAARAAARPDAAQRVADVLLRVGEGAR